MRAAGGARARASRLGCQLGHKAVHLRTLEVRVRRTRLDEWLGAGAEAALSTLWTGADTVVGENLPAFITEAGVRGSGSSIWVGSSQRVEGVFIGEDRRNNRVGTPCVYEAVSGGDEVVVVGVGVAP